MKPNWTLLAARLFDGRRWHDSACVQVHGALINVVTGAGDGIPAAPAADLTLEHGFLIPGLVDLQVNGGGGVLLNNQPDPENLQRMLGAHLGLGTTGLLPTLLSDHPDRLAAALDAVRTLRRERPDTPALGLHVEGPWFAPSRRGAHAADRVRPPRPEEVAALCQAADVVRIVTLAPEVMQPGQIRQLCEAGIRVLAGHSEASAAQLALAQAEGLSGFTHLYNAMSPLTAREPGMVGTALSVAGYSASLIADGHHVHPDSIRLAAHCLGAERLYAVSDAMATVGSGSRHFPLYREQLEVRDGRLVNREGRLAGSAISLLDALQYLHRQVGLPLTDCLRMCTSTPASLLAGAPVGQIAPGHRADLLWLSDKLEVLGVWQAGRRI